MSRIGKKPIAIPQGVTVTVEQNIVNVSGPKGKKEVVLPTGVLVKVENNFVDVTRASDSKIDRQNHGTYRSLIHNAIVGVNEGYQRRLEIVGIGYRAALRGENLVLTVGYSHEVIIAPLPGVKISVPENTVILVSGIDKQMVGEIAANIRNVRPPEPYLGKGIRYAGEHIRRKEGKRAMKT
jgi:large subunit ribosomal protein L6